MDSRGQKVWQPVAACGTGVLPLKEDCRLQSCRFGCLESQKVGLDWIGFEWLLESCNLTRSTFREVGGFTVTGGMRGIRVTFVLD